MGAMQQVLLGQNMGGASVDPHWANVISLLNADGADSSTTIIDLKSKIWTPAGNTQIDTSLGYNTILFDGNDSASTPNHSDWDFGSGDFTVEMWIYPLSVTGFQNLARKSVTSAHAPFSLALDGNKFRVRLSTSGSSWAIDVTTALAVTNSALNHVAIAREGTVIRIYVNGVQNSAPGIVSALMANASAVHIGAQSDAAGGYTGHIRAMRTTKGLCLYPGGTTFIPESAPFPTPALWTPANLTSPPTFWADDTASVIDAGAGACSEWADLSGNGYNATQTGPTDRPLIVPANLNGLRTLTFAGSGDSLELPAGAKAVANAAGALWCFAVYKNSTSSATIRNLLGVSTNTTATIRFGMQTSRTSNTDKPTLGVRRLDSNSFASLSAATAISTSWGLAAVRMDYTNGDGFVDVNGILSDAVNTALTTSGATSATNPTDQIVIGTGVGGSGNSWNGELAAILFGGVLPSVAEMDKLFGYYAHRYALTALLASTHPYKYFAPYQ